MISAQALISLVIWLVVAGLIYWLCEWALGSLGIPEPFNKVIRVIMILIVFFIVLNALLTLAGWPLLRLH